MCLQRYHQLICARRETERALCFKGLTMAAAKIGRPTVMTPDTKDLLLEAIEGGTPVRKACRSVGVEPESFYQAMTRDPEFAERYEAAKAAAVDALIHEGEDVLERHLTAENGTQVAASKNLADYKFRMASRIAPQKWGDKSTVQLTTQLDSSDQEMAKRIAFLEALNGNGPGDDAEPDDDGGDLV